MIFVGGSRPAREPGKLGVALSGRRNHFLASDQRADDAGKRFREAPRSQIHPPSVGLSLIQMRARASAFSPCRMTAVG